MPFDEEDESPEPQKINLKKVSTQKSIFDTMPKKPTQDNLDREAKRVQEKSSSYKLRASELANLFKKSMDDKTLVQNKNIFSQEMERELLSKMINLALEINNDSNEQEGMGSLGWISVILKQLFHQRDKINKLEYSILQLEKKIDSVNLTDIISKEISKVIDKKKVDE